MMPILKRLAVTLTLRHGMILMDPSNSHLIGLIDAIILDLLGFVREPHVILYPRGEHDLEI